MTRDEAKEYIQEHATEILDPDKYKGFICPVCGSGSGKSGTGITTKDGVHFTCWAGCYSNADIIDILGILNNVSDYNEKLKIACDTLGLDYERLENTYNKQYTHNTYKTYSTHNTNNTDDTNNVDYTAFYKEAEKHRKESDYMKQRGISEKTLKHFHIGYVKEWQSPTALKNGKKPPASSRVIIPVTRTNYIARATDNTNALTKMKEGASGLYNKKALQNEYCFICEGEIDAMSFYEMGQPACGLGSVNNYKKLIEELNTMEIKPFIYIALDNDEAGNKTASKLLEELNIKNIGARITHLYGDFKDANEILINNPSMFEKALEIEICKPREAINELKEEYLKNNAGYSVNDFLNGINERANTPAIKTGFKCLDDMLDGGIYEGLYFIGANSSTGKTTFLLQVADQIAEQGQDVLIFSLEMARNELIAKSISRNTARICIKNKGDILKLGKSTRDITVKSKYANYDDKQKETIKEAITLYKEYANNIYIVEGIGDITTNQINETIKKHISFTGNTPIVIIDYLQILAPADIRATDKTNIDKNVSALKRISRDYKTPVIAISSFNRDNYNNPVSMASFKESGAIEYSSDVLIGLQLAGMDNPKADFKELQENANKNARNGNAIKLQIKILKNRNGVKNDTFINFYPRYNYFIED